MCVTAQRRLNSDNRGGGASAATGTGRCAFGHARSASFLKVPTRPTRLAGRNEAVDTALEAGGLGRCLLRVDDRADRRGKGLKLRGQSGVLDNDAPVASFFADTPCLLAFVRAAIPAAIGDIIKFCCLGNRGAPLDMPEYSAGIAIQFWLSLALPHCEYGKASMVRAGIPDFERTQANVGKAFINLWPGDSVICGFVEHPRALPVVQGAVSAASCDRRNFVHCVMFGVLHRAQRVQSNHVLLYVCSECMLRH